MAGAVIGTIEGVPITMADLVAAHQRGDHVVYGGPEVGAFWASKVQARPPRKTIEESLDAIFRGDSPAEIGDFVRDSRDYKVEDGLWRSDLLPQGVSIDQAIKDGVW